MKHSGIMGACASDAALDSSCSVAVILSLAGTDIVEYATCRSALVSDNARYMHSRTCHSQSQNISPSFVSELTVNKTMRRYSLGFCEPQGKCNCIRERNGLSGSVAFRFVSCRRVAFRLLSCRRCVRPLVHLRFLSFCVDASWNKRKRQT